MTDHKVLPDPNETPEDVATLYSWANLHGAKYRDFSASRAQTREKARLRVQEAIEEERRRAREDAEAQRIAQTQRAAGAAREEEETRKAELMELERAEQAAQQVARQAAQQASQQATQQRAWEQQRAERESAPPPASPAPSYAPEIPSYAPQAASFTPLSPSFAAQVPGNGAPAPSFAVPAQGYAAQDPGFALPVQGYDSQAPRFVPPTAPLTPPSAPYYPVPQEDVPAYAAPQQNWPVAGQAQYAPVREEHYTQERNHWAPVEPKESTGRPAWLAADNSDRSSQPIPHAPEDTLQGSRDRLTSRWFALKGVFEGATVAVEAPAPVAARAPVLAVFSLAGGVGKTSLVATLGRALSSRGERVLLVDTAAYGLLPFFFGARDQRPGMLRTFSPPGISGDAPIQLVTVDPETMGPENAAQETLTQEIAKASRGVSRVIVDLATASGATTRRVMRMAPTILVPVIPDMSSVVSVSSIDAFFQRNTAPGGKQMLPCYVLNQFDPSLPLHLDVREVLREQLGDRLLPFALRRTPAVSEALAEGMTVMDYAPNSTAAEDFGSLAGWVKSLAAPASNGYRGVRWSER
jgi:cellulose synthase operon protein YhjQ